MNLKKVSLFSTFTGLMFLFSCVSTSNKLGVENPLDVKRSDEPLILKRSDLVTHVGEIPAGKIPLVKTQEGIIIPSQADDLDFDGKWDELFLLVDIEGSQTLTLSIDFVDPGELPEFTVRTNIRFGDKKPPHPELNNVERLKSNVTAISSKHFQMEGPAWENDIVGFRNYFDARNGIDIYGKRVEEMSLDSVGLHESYHELADWGMDILKVGNSLGAGSVAMMVGGSVYRLGLTKGAHYKRIVEGPLRSVFELSFDGWEIAGNTYSALHRISIWGGQYFYKSEVTVSGLTGNESLVTGIVNMQSDTFYMYDESNYVALITHDNQAFDGEKLGMGVVTEKNDFIESMTAPEEGPGIVQTYMMSITLEPNKPVTYYFYVGWELQDPELADMDNFVSILQEDMERFSNPLNIKYQ